MKPNVYWKMVLRRPLRTFLLLFFLSIVSFVFVSRMTEYIIVDREIEQIGKYYRSIGTLRLLDPTQEDVSLGADLITQSSYVDFEDRQRYSSGVLKELYNADVGGGSLDYSIDNDTLDSVDPHNIWLYGILTNKEYNQELGAFGGYSLSVKVDRIEAGYPEYITEGQTATLLFLLKGKNDTVLDGLQVGERYLLRAFYDREYNTKSWTFAQDSLFLTPIDDDSLWFVPVEPGKTADFSHPSLKGIRDIIALAAENQRSMWVYATKDMSAMPDMQEDARYYYLTDGRWLTYDDTLSGRKVCVVHSEFAKLRNLAIGDKITLSLRDLKSSNYLGYITSEEDQKGWSKYPEVEDRFEIVGLYGLLLGANQPTRRNTMMYIPASSMPDSFYFHDGKPVYPEMYNFVLKSSKHQEAFLEKYEAQLQRLGLEISFLDNNGKTYWSSVQPLQRSAALNAVVFSLVLILVLIMVTLLNFYQCKKEFAIQRALGIPRKQAIFQFIVPMAVIGFLGICVGGVLSWQFTLQKAMGTLNTIQGPAGVETTANLSSTWLIGLCGGSFAVFILFIVVSAGHMAHHPVLELLQGVSRVGRRRRKIKKMPLHKKEWTEDIPVQTKIEARQMESSFTGFGNVPINSVNKGHCFLASIRYVLRHIRRSVIKSASAVAIAMCFLLALGWMNQKIRHDKEEIERQYTSIVVEAEILQNNPSITLSDDRGVIFKRTIEEVIDTGIIQDYYLEAKAPRTFLTPQTENGWDDTHQVKDILLYGFNTAEVFFNGTGKYITPEYGLGYNETLFAEGWTIDKLKAGGKVPVLLSVSMMERLGVSLGDGIFVMDNSDAGGMFLCVIAGQYEGGFVDIHKDVVLLPLSPLEIIEEDNKQNLGYSVAQFRIDPAKNKELSVFRKEMKELVTNPGAGLLDLNFILWDDELRRVVEPLDKNLQLMTVLYPVTLSLSILIAAGISILLVLQNARETAIMRVLGIARWRVCVILSVEQILMSLIGIIFGLIILVFSQNEMTEPLIPIYLMCASSYFAGCAVGAIFTAVSVTNRMPLDLLQVKE